MMQMMIAPEWLHPFERRTERMNAIMNGAIHQISQRESWKKRIGPCSQEIIKQREKNCRNQQTRNRRHEQSVAVTRKIMMIAMKQIMQPLAPNGSWFKMKDKPMDQILSQRPAQKT